MIIREFIIQTLTQRYRFIKIDYRGRIIHTVCQMASVNRSLLNLFKQRPEWKNLTKLQKEFFYQFFQKKNLFLTGPAGTGKSYCVNLLIDFLDEKEIFYGKTATTGVAALNVSGITIHSWSGMGLADDDGMALLEKVVDNKKACGRIKSSKVLIVDEISMAKSELLDKLDIVCQYIRNSDKPFGGIQVILVGDFLQLPPVFTHFEKEKFAFESQAWRDARVSTVHLTEIVRQHDEPEFASFLNQVRMGTCQNFDILEPCHDREFPDDGIIAVKLFCKNIDVDNFNRNELAKIKAPNKHYYSTDEGGEQWTKFFDKNCRAPAALELKVGAQVMLVKNVDTENGLVNGSVGVVESLHSDTVEVRFTTGEVHVIEPQKWEVKQIEDDGLGGMAPKVVATRKQIPLKLAWALTIHKSQGQTLDRAEINASEAFAEGQVYVALSRVRNLKSLKLHQFHPRKITVNKKCLDFYNQAPPIEADFFEEEEE